MARITKEQRQKILEKYNTDRIWSFSRINTYDTCPWIYRMNYLEKVDVDTSNIYTVFGTASHDIVEQVYNGELKAENMASEWNDFVLSWQLDENRHEFMSENVEENYLQAVGHYFSHAEILPYDVKTERTLLANFKDSKGENIVFVGYADAMYYDDEETLVILDFKTSSDSQFSGAKLRENSRQLLLYSIAAHQMFGIPYNKIQPKFDMMKYVTVEFLQKNGKWRASRKDRHKWVESQENRIRTILLENDYDIFEIEDMVAEAKMLNSLEKMPDYVQERFKISNAYIDVEINEEIIEELTTWIIETVEEIKDKEQGDWKEEFPEPLITPQNEFYYTNLQRPFLKYHKGWQEEQEMKRIRGELEIGGEESEELKEVNDLINSLFL